MNQFNKFPSRTSKLTLLLLLLLMFFSLTGCVLPSSNTGELRVHFIYVDQGDCILVELPNDEVAMIDCGIGLYTGKDSVTNIQSYLRNNEITKIDYTIISHPHNDHMGAYISIAEEFKMYDVYTTSKTHTTQAYAKFLAKIDELNGNLYFPEAGDYIVKDVENDLTIQAISVIDDSNVNNCSLVVKLVYKNNSFLFTGDSEILAERAIVDSKFDCQADVLKVGHHGSKNSSTQYLLDKVNAKYGILTTTKNVSGTGHPHSEAINRLLLAKIDLYETGVYENIIITCDGNNYKFSALSSTGMLTENLEPSRKASE